MTDPLSLIQALRRGRPDAEVLALAAEVDPLALAGLVVQFFAWPVLDPEPSSWAGTSDATSSARVDTPEVVCAVDLVRAVVDADPAAAAMAADVSTLELAFFGLTVLSWPAMRDPRPYLDVYELAHLLTRAAP